MKEEQVHAWHNASLQLAEISDLCQSHLSELLTRVRYALDEAVKERMEAKQLRLAEKAQHTGPKTIVTRRASTMSGMSHAATSHAAASVTPSRRFSATPTHQQQHPRDPRRRQSAIKGHTASSSSLHALMSGQETGAPEGTTDMVTSTLQFTLDDAARALHSVITQAGSLARTIQLRQDTEAALRKHRARRGWAAIRRAIHLKRQKNGLRQLLAFRRTHMAERVALLKAMERMASSKSGSTKPSATPTPVTTATTTLGTDLASDAQKPLAVPDAAAQPAVNQEQPSSPNADVQHTAARAKAPQARFAPDQPQTTGTTANGRDAATTGAPAILEVAIGKAQADAQQHEPQPSKGTKGSRANAAQATESRAGGRSSPDTSHTTSSRHTKHGKHRTHKTHGKHRIHGGAVSKRKDKDDNVTGKEQSAAGVSNVSSLEQQGEPPVYLAIAHTRELLLQMRERLRDTDQRRERFVTLDELNARRTALNEAEAESRAAQGEAEELQAKASELRLYLERNQPTESKPDRVGIDERASLLLRSITKFESLVTRDRIADAALLATTAPDKILRTQATWQRFMSMKGGSVWSIYCRMLLVHSPTDEEVVMCVQEAINRNALSLTANWYTAVSTEWDGTRWATRWATRWRRGGGGESKR